MKKLPRSDFRENRARNFRASPQNRYQNRLFNLASAHFSRYSLFKAFVYFFGFFGDAKYKQEKKNINKKSHIILHGY